MFLHILLNTSKICKNWKVLIPASWRNELLINVSDLYIRFCLCQIILLCSSAKTGFLIHRKRWKTPGNTSTKNKNHPSSFPDLIQYLASFLHQTFEKMKMITWECITLWNSTFQKKLKNYPYYAHSSINALHEGKIYSNTKLMSRKTSLNLNTEKKCPCASTRGRKVSRLQSANSKYELIKSINLSH